MSDFLACDNFLGRPSPTQVKERANEPKVRGLAQTRKDMCVVAYARSRGDLQMFLIVARSCGICDVAPADTHGMILGRGVGMH